VKRSESGRYSNSSGARPRGGRPGRTGRCRTARIFISHSSRDDEPARRMKAWLKAQGFENTFPDKDKLTGIPPADWEKTLYREIERSHAVVIIQTPQWLASKWCFAEFTQARALGKAILPVIETLTGDTRISPDIQTLDLTDDPRAQTSRSTRMDCRVSCAGVRPTKPTAPTRSTLLLTSNTVILGCCVDSRSAYIGNDKFHMSYIKAKSYA
jgi:hypothetical protein